MPASRPRIPFAEWPVQLAVSSGFIWYTDPGVFVTQSYIEHATLDGTMAMTTCVDAVLRYRGDELRRLGGLLIIHDWRSLKTWDTDARQHLVQRSKDRRPGEVRAVVIALSINPLLRMAAQVINVMMAAAGAASLDIVDSVAPALTKHRVKTPSPSDRFPGRSQVPPPA
jgi:hypothetical protein